MEKINGKEAFTEALDNISHRPMFHVVFVMMGLDSLMIRTMVRIEV